MRELPSRWRILALAVVVLLAVGTVVVTVSRSAERARDLTAQAAARAEERPQERLDPATVRTQPHVAVLGTVLGPDFGKVALVPLSAPTGPRAVLDPSCDRVYATAQRYLCLRADRGAITTYEAELFDDTMTRTARVAVPGSPSRARLSHDGKLAAMTVFVAGHSYLDSGFSTRTTVHDGTDGRQLADLEDFAIDLGGKRYRAADVNFWGVTFARDADTFFATMSTAGKTHLVEGRLSERRLRALRENSECPSLSPDGSQVAYKTRVGGASAQSWRLAVLDLDSGQQVLLSEDRSVDDQAEWLDDQTLLYTVPRDEGVGTVASDVWRVQADGSGRPAVFVPDAGSPAVVR